MSRPSFFHALCAAFAVGAIAAPAHALDPQRGLTQYVHDAWSVRHGLSHNSVRCVAQDTRGYLWIGSRKGLLRFDGLTFTPFAVEPNDVLSVVSSRRGVWVGTSRPGHLYLIENDAVQQRYSFGDRKVEKVYEDEAGVAWIGTSDGLYVLEGTTLERVELEGEPHPMIYAIVGDGEGGLWIGGEQGLFHRSAGRTRRYTTRDGLAADDVHALFRDTSGAVWVGTGRSGLTRVRDGKARTYGTSEAVPFGTVFALAGDRDDNLWVGTKKGLLRFRNERFVGQPPPVDLGTGQIEDIFLDREASLWVSTQDRGLHRLRDGAITSYGSDVGLPERIWAVHRQDNGFLLGADDGVVHWNTATGAIRRHSLRDCDGGEGRVRAMLRDSRGVLWLGVKGRVFRWVPSSAAPVEVEALREPLGCQIIESFVEDRRGTMWIGLRERGLLRLRDGAVRRFTAAEGLPTSDLRAVHEARDGTLWVGTTRGLVRMEGERFVPEGEPDFIDTLYEDSEGALWVGTYEQGLKRLKRGRWLRLRREHGLPSDTVLTLTEGDRDHLWVMCEKGIYRLGIRQFEAAAEGRAPLPPPRLYGESDGMRSLAAFGSRDPGVVRTADGRLWFGTPNGVAVVDPSRLPVNDVPPPVVIEAVLRNGRPVDLRKVHEFPAGAASYEFRYTSLSLVAPDRVDFIHQLEGVEGEWVEAGGRRRAVYAQLSPGEYRFVVKARNEDGVWSRTPAVFTFRQQPFFHQTWQFLALCASGLVLLGAGLGILRVRRMAARQDQLRRLVEERTRELDRARRLLEDNNRQLEHRVEEGVAALREAERMAAYGQMVAAVAHEVRHPIFALQAAAYVVRDQLGGAGVLQSQLGTLETETRRLNALMTELLDFAKPAHLELGTVSAAALFHEVLTTFRGEGYDLRVEIDVAPDAPAATLDRFRVVQALLNLMRNAVLHASGVTHLTLAARRIPWGEGDGLRLSVTDDGAGIPSAQAERIFEPFVTGGKGTGLGLAIVRRFVAAHGGSASVESTRGRGSTFHLDFPLRPPATARRDEAASAGMF